MKFTLPKRRIMPLILLAILGTLMSLIFGLYYMKQMVEFSYKTTADTYDALTLNTAVMLRQDIEHNFQSLQNSADLIGQSGELDKEKIASLLTLIGDHNGYLDLAIVTADGKGYNMSGSDINVSEETYFVNALDGQEDIADSIVYTGNKEPSIMYAAPILENGSCKGVLLATVNAELDTMGYIDQGGLGSPELYILNDKKQIVSYSKGSDITDFKYEDIVEKGYLQDNYVEKMSELDFINFLHDTYGQENNIAWYQKPLEINNWTVLIGNVNLMNPALQKLLKISNMIWVSIIIGIFLLFAVLIFSQRRSNRKVNQMLYLDPVTEGGNWYKFRIDVNKILTGRQFSKKRFALINFDINRFKVINDVYGYQRGDEVLKDIFTVLKKWAKPGEPFTRYSADQFYILLMFQDEQEVSERISELNEQLHLLRYTRTVKFYFGIYFITERRDSIDRMGDFAGIAKHRIKENNEGIISFFDDIARKKLLEEEEIEKSMHDALKNNEFIVYLQPKYTAKEETVSGAEALVRWSSSNGTLISPGYFIPVFEKNGFIMELDLYMVRKVCEVLRDWLDKGYSTLPISVNISRIHFADPSLADKINEIADYYDIPHDLIELELTESAFLQNKQTLIKTVIRLKQFGFLVSMDDFGAGYSSLNSLKDLPLDTVKLDGELFRITEQAERGFTVIRNTISMAKDLHMQVVAECIETREQVEFLCTMGCDIIQGYVFARPMPVEQFESRYFSMID